MATELGQAYVRIMPSAKGITGSITKELGGEAESAGKSTGSKIIGAIKGVIATAAIGKAIGASLMEGAALQQSLGGIETLFKSSADTVKKHAEEAYRTTGLSANAYMENVTGFSASLLQSLGGDTDKAAKISNMAMIDMADNSNKMGTSMEAIQFAYQGFAKQNYTMLDNLKLGYGGTKSEMERLLADATKLTGVKYDINNLSDVYEAIHAVQTEIGITGTTALEAAETFSGSFAAMKAAAQNALGAIALGENIGPALEGLAQTVSTFLFGNLIPMVKTIISSLPSAIVIFFQTAAPLFLQAGTELITQLATGITTGIPTLMTNITGLIANITMWMTTQFPLIMQKGVELLMSLLNGILSAIPNVINGIGALLSSILQSIGKILPTLFQKGTELIAQLANGILTNLPGQKTSVGSSLNSNFNEILSDVFKILSDAMPKMLENGLSMIMQLAQGVLKNIPEIISAIRSVVTKLLDTIVQNLPEFLQKGVELIGKIASGIAQNIPAVVTSITEAMAGLLQVLAQHLPQILAKGVELAGRLAVGLLQALPTILSSVAQIGAGILKGLAGLVGQMVSAGANLMQGLANGIAGAVKGVISRAIDACRGVVDKVKSFFGIRSPSRVFAEIGAFLDEGLAKGIADNTKPISRAMDDVTKLTSRSFESDIALAATAQTRLQSFGSIESAGSKSDRIIALLEMILRKSADVYIDRDTLVGTILDDVDQGLADKQNITDIAYGGV